MKFLSIEISSDYDEENAICELENLGYDFLYLSSDVKTNKIILHVSYLEEYSSLNLPFILKIEESSFDGIDWEDQWRLNCKGYENNRVEIKLSEYIPLKEEKELYLQAGPGFGDLSHPTTRMMIKMIFKYCKGKPFVDVGCGSGILSFVANLLGSSVIYGYDIDNEALIHARKNKILNKNSENIIFDQFDLICKKLSSLNCPIIGLNMIEMEQKEAWKEISNFLPKSYEILSSGVKKEHRDSYLKQVKAKGWHLMDELKEGEWLCFHFVIK